MNYKETLFFIGLCLTISHEKENKLLVEKQLQKGNINWDNIVKVSTAHYVFPALFCNLKRVGFLQYLPKDLVEYMEYITSLNRDRNEQILTQAKEITQILLRENITPIYLKGTSNLLSGLYQDIGERMVGDIDFLVSKEHADQAFNILKKNGYQNKTTKVFDDARHLPRLTNKDRIAAVEIHEEMLHKDFAKNFSYQHIQDTILQKNGDSFLSLENQLALTIFSKQLNDHGQHFFDIALKNSYDIFLLSLKVNSLDAIAKYDVLFHPANNYLACSAIALSSKNIIHNSTIESQTYTLEFLDRLQNTEENKSKRKKTNQKLFFKDRLSIIKNAFTNKKIRNWLLQRITSKAWLKEKLKR
ncbi:conserved protein of unknown function [Tenacibaculum sp. 190130A14a]|uniref:Nucleotidyltransferase-like protein n=1 Tax=Tenacibaculum polynesiense TaxID=3137857 RepID=A0ABM9P8R6_9FLAO